MPGVSDSERARRLQTPQAQQLLAAARRLVAEQGVEASSVAQMAAAAGMSTGLVHYYFGPKHSVIGEIIRADAAERVSSLEQLRGVTTVDELLQKLAQVMVDATSEGGQLALQELTRRAARDDTLGVPYRAAERGCRDALTAILVDLAERQVVVLHEDSSSIAGVLIAMSRGIAAQTLVDPEWDVEGTWDCARVMARALLAADD